MSTTRVTTDIDEAVAVLAAGGIVGLPTETVYGLAARVSDETAVRRVFAAKGRPADHPLLVAWRDLTHPCHTRVVLNAHNAFYSEEGVRDMRVKGSEACRRALLGQPLRNVIN